MSPSKKQNIKRLTIEYNDCMSQDSKVNPISLIKLENSGMSFFSRENNLYRTIINDD